MISIIIPHLNQPEHLRRCLQSLTDQRFDMNRAEIIVVDNGSSELPVEICAEFPGIRLESEPDPGPGPARNKGIALSKGEILAFIDADCLADSNWISVIHRAVAEERTAEIIGGDVRIAAKDTSRLTMIEAYESVFAYRQKEYIERQGFSGTGNLAMLRSAYDGVGPFAGIEIAEDRDWGRRATRLGYHIRYLPEMIVYHPARQSMRELLEKWDRQISHDFRENSRGFRGTNRWLALSAAMFVSPAFEIPRIWTSDRIAGNRARCLAFLALLRIREYRAVQMLKALFSSETATSSRSWNRT